MDYLEPVPPPCEISSRPVRISGDEKWISPDEIHEIARPIIERLRKKLTEDKALEAAAECLAELLVPISMPKETWEDIAQKVIFTYGAECGYRLFE
jgi:hypothetical protein